MSKRTKETTSDLMRFPQETFDAPAVWGARSQCDMGCGARFDQFPQAEFEAMGAVNLGRSAKLQPFASIQEGSPQAGSQAAVSTSQVVPFCVARTDAQHKDVLIPADADPIAYVTQRRSRSRYHGTTRNMIIHGRVRDTLSV